MDLERSKRADRIIHSHTLWSMGAGMIPVPMFDILAVSAIQVDMLKQLAEAYESDFTENMGKTFVTALTGGHVRSNRRIIHQRRYPVSGRWLEARRCPSYLERQPTLSARSQSATMKRTARLVDIDLELRQKDIR